MGRIRPSFVKIRAIKLVNEYPGEFTPDFDANKAEITKLKNELQEIQRYIDTSEISISQRRSDLDKNMLVLTEQLAIYKNKENQIPLIKSELAETSQIYDQRTFLVDEQIQINILEQNKDLLNYNHETHLSLQNEVSNLECYDSLFSQLSKKVKLRLIFLNH